MIEIKIAKQNDAKSISLLGRITFSETFGHLFNDKNDLFEYCDLTFSVEKIRNGIKKEDNVFYIAMVNELPVGYAKFKHLSKTPFISSKNVCQLQKIYVLKDFISMKIGSKLQTTLVKMAKENRYEKVWLSVLKSNDRAIKFYKKNDFEIVGNHGFQIGKEKFNFIVMSKVL